MLRAPLEESEDTRPIKMLDSTFRPAYGPTSSLEVRHAMKTLVPFLVLLLSAAVGSADDGEVTSKIIEAHRPDGKVDARTETVYRGTNKVMVVTSRRNAKGKMIVEWRQYFVGEKLVTVERDRNGDGRLEVVQVFGPDGVTSEIFIRDADGNVKPARKLNKHEACKKATGQG